MSLVRCERTERIMVLIISMESVKQSVSVQEIGGKKEVQTRQYVLVNYVFRKVDKCLYNRDAIYQTILPFFED